MRNIWLLFVFCLVATANAGAANKDERLEVVLTLAAASSSQTGVAGSTLPAPIDIQAKLASGGPAADVTIVLREQQLMPSILVSKAAPELGAHLLSLKTDANGKASAYIQLAYGIGAGHAYIEIAASDPKYVLSGKPARVEFTANPVDSGMATWYLWGVMGMCVVTLIGCFLLTGSILKRPVGSAEMQEVNKAISTAAAGFFNVQYRWIAYMSIPMAVLLYFVYLLREQSATDPKISKSVMGALIGFDFLLGATCSAISGFVGMWVSIRANIRVAQAAHNINGFDDSLQLAIRSGAVAGFLVVALSACGISFLFMVLMGMGASYFQPQQIPMLIVGYGFGASFVALFAQLGGGIYTKAADVGADIVGKIEGRLAEDDLRNPAVVADLVGDNVGDCAGRGADLFESISAENIGAMILAGTLASQARPIIENPYPFIMFPLIIRVLGIICSFIGIIAVHGKKQTEEELPLVQGQAKAQDPMDCLTRGYGITVLLATGAMIGLCWYMLNPALFPAAWWHFAICGIIGIWTSYAFVFITVYYTDFKYEPVRRIAESSKTGHGTNVITGLAVGMESTSAPVVVIATAILSSFWLGNLSGLVDENNVPVGGLFGIAVATMGMLSPAAFILAMDTFGPITDNAGGICEMGKAPPEARAICDRMDAVGNTTKALTKGYAIGSAALAAFLLFAAYMDEVAAYTNTPFGSVNLAVPEVFTGALIGAGLIFLFSALAIRAVGSTAEIIIEDVRAQWDAKPGILEFKDVPDYQSCVEKAQAGALKHMILPGLLSVAVPVIVGLAFRAVGAYTDRPNLGAEVSAGLLMVGTITGILMALFLNNGGGAWDNAKKYIECGGLGENHRHKGCLTHAAAVTGDTVGDPCKDTAGPSIHVLIKLLATVTLVIGPLYLNQVAVYASD